MTCVCSIIVAVSVNNVIGHKNKIPWNYPGDLKRFKELTTGQTVIMGRNTWESIPAKFRPLPNRRNIVITSQELDGVECFTDILSALDTCQNKVWFIGGAQIYKVAMRYCNTIDVTYVPDTIRGGGLVFFPEIDEEVFEAGDLVDHEYEPELKRREFKRILP